MYFIVAEECIGCNFCVEVCDAGAVRVEGDVYIIDPNACAETGACLEVCPVGAIVKK
ncbi:MAG: DUF362 domain-containing protein [bacterium]